MIEHKIWVEWDDVNDEPVWKCECGCWFSHKEMATNHVKHQKFGYPHEMNDEEVKDEMNEEGVE